MLKITPDTNILISSFISEGNEYKLLKLAKLGKIKIILSLDILKEFKEVISRQKFSFSKEQIEKAFKQLLSLSEIIIPKVKIDIIKEDSTDNIILECALTGKVNYIVSGDKHLLKLKKYKKIKIIKTLEIIHYLQQ